MAHAWLHHLTGNRKFRRLAQSRLFPLPLLLSADLVPPASCVKETEVLTVIRHEHNHGSARMHYSRRKLCPAVENQYGVSGRTMGTASNIVPGEAASGHGAAATLPECRVSMAGVP